MSEVRLAALKAACSAAGTVDWRVAMKVAALVAWSVEHWAVQKVAMKGDLLVVWKAGSWAASRA